MNVPAIPAAAPQPTMIRRRLAGTRRNCPNTEPTAAPICTKGPTRPTELPVPMQTAEASVFTSNTLGGIKPPLRATASMTSGTP